MKDDVLDVPNIGTRVFKRPRCRILSAKTGEVIAPEKLAAGLVAVAVLEHARSGGKRSHGEKVVCGCGALLEIKRCGVRLKRCDDCRKKLNRERAKAKREKNAEKMKVRRQERIRERRAKDPEAVRAIGKPWRQANRERLRKQARDAHARRRAAKLTKVPTP